MRVLADAEQVLREAAAHSRYPKRRVEALLPDANAADTLLNRLLAEGMPLERFAGFGDDLVSRRARSAALEGAWDGMVRVAAAESARWRTVATQVAVWRRPVLALWCTSVAVLGVVLVVAGWLSGELPAPGWFRGVNDFWWRLWP